MDNNSHKPIVLVFADPNGSGKTTISQRKAVVCGWVLCLDVFYSYLLYCPNLPCFSSSCSIS
jgi:uridine kinase